MKKFLYIAIIGIVIWSCGGDGDDPPPPPENKAPSTPTLLKPINEENDEKPTCIDPNVLFEWSESTDPDGDKVYYTVEVSKQIDFSTIDQKEENILTTSTVILIDKGTKFYWRVKATDNEDESDFSSTFKIYTEGDGVSIYAPFSPELVAPNLDVIVKESDFSPATNLNAIFEWTASHPYGDPLTFDVYIETTPISSPIPEELNPKSQNQTGTTYDYSLAPLTNYYWRIVVKNSDSEGKIIGQTTGQTWSFKTD